jgi:hypothetical protein
MQTGHRGARRVARTHEAIEKALTGAKVKVGALAVLAIEDASTTKPIVLSRAELVEHLQRQQARTLDAPGQRVIADITAAVQATPPHRAPVIIATKEGRAILQWVEGEPAAQPVTSTARSEVLRLLLDGPRLGWDIRDELVRFRRDVVGQAISGLAAEGAIEAIERRGRLVTWQLTAKGRAMAAGKAAA